MSSFSEMAYERGFGDAEDYFEYLLDKTYSDMASCDADYDPDYDGDFDQYVYSPPPPAIPTTTIAAIDKCREELAQCIVKTSPHDPSLVNIFCRLLFQFERLKKHGAALFCVNRALAISRASGAVPDRPLYLLYARQGQLLCYLGQQQDALDSYMAALDSLETEQPPPGLDDIELHATELALDTPLGSKPHSTTLYEHASYCAPSRVCDLAIKLITSLDPVPYDKLFRFQLARARRRVCSPVATFKMFSEALETASKTKTSVLPFPDNVALMIDALEVVANNFTPDAEWLVPQEYEYQHLTPLQILIDAVGLGHRCLPFLTCFAPSAAEISRVLLALRKCYDAILDWPNHLRPYAGPAGGQVRLP